MPPPSGTQVGCFVLLGSSEHSLVDARDYFRPVVTPFELVLALGSGEEWTGEYLLDYAPLLPRLAAAAEAAEAAAARGGRVRGNTLGGRAGGDTGGGGGSDTAGEGGGDTGGGFDTGGGGGSDEDLPPEHSLLSGRLIGASGCQASRAAAARQDTGGGALAPARRDTGGGALAPAGLLAAAGGARTLARTGAEFLSQRSWRGLEVRAGEDAPATLQPGRRGIASGFNEEGGGGLRDVARQGKGGQLRGWRAVPAAETAYRRAQPSGDMADGAVPRVRACVLATSASAVATVLRVG